MNMAAYIASLRARIATMIEDKSAITERGVQGWIRWGTEPAVQTTHTWLAELERRIDELTCITDALEKGRRI